MGVCRKLAAPYAELRLCLFDISMLSEIRRDDMCFTPLNSYHSNVYGKYGEEGLRDCKDGT